MSSLTPRTVDGGFTVISAGGGLVLREENQCASVTRQK